MALDTAKSFLQPSRNHAFVTFNNQNSVLMSMLVQDQNRLYVLHDNRIFAFQNGQGNSYEGSTSNEQNVLLNLLTTPKYRAMSAIYMIFRLLDNMFFLSIIILSIYNGAFTLPSAANIALLTTIGVELFYDVMMMTNKYWILERLSIYIGIVLYGFYFGFVFWKQANGEFDSTVNETTEEMTELTTEMTPDDEKSGIPYKLVYVLAFLVVRFIAFIMEEFVDIAIDGELHNDLLKLRHPQNNSHNQVQNNIQGTVENHRETVVELGQNDDQPLLHGNRISYWSCCCCGSFQTWLIKKKTQFKEYMNVDKVITQQKVKYEGSFFAWSPKSIYTKNVCSVEPFPRWLIYTLCSFPFLGALLLLIVLLLLCIIASLIPILFIYIIFIPISSCASCCHLGCLINNCLVRGLFTVICYIIYGVAFLIFVIPFVLLILLAFLLLLIVLYFPLAIFCCTCRRFKRQYNVLITSRSSI